MNLSLTDAARLLGKTPRQLRYLIKTGGLPAHKDGARWVLNSDDLPLSAGQLQSRQRKADALSDAVHEALGPHLSPPGKRRYGVQQVRAFMVGQPVWRDAMDVLGADHAATTALQDCLIGVSQGCHRYHARDKLAAYTTAREHAARGVVLLLLQGGEPATAIADRIEQELLPAITGLIRRAERRERQ